ncbi:sulfatase-like hydrolase/transferase [Permianibacter sp. IMCC34836]|uniref:sulfatase-like hydrolase/transferase n=1 Tax=Permianibacter fluminis TaxID=2738515 RepID=UPI0015525CAA|nr:sulfatase-like hydrolase/transferase [Permianibacter fluminis]NQD37032.1 sulfatase-like hydrolase/transferase [Permianibacter fluminis]
MVLSTKLSRQLLILRLLALCSLGFVFYLQFLVPTLVGSASKGMQLDIIVTVLTSSSYLTTQLALFLLLSFILWAGLVWLTYRTVAFFMVRRSWRYRTFVPTFLLYTLLSWMAIGFANNVIYSGSRFDLLVPIYLRNTVTEIVVAAILSLLVAVPMLVALWLANRKKTVYAAAAILLAITISHNIDSGFSPAAKTSQPNVIIIGVDSFSPFQLGRYHEENFSNFISKIEQMHWFADSVPSVPRTFGSWSGILTGLDAVDSGARFNLTPIETVKTDRSIAYDFHNAGYRTVFAMDERLFANIDQRYGFDEVVGPRMGAIDFLISTIADLPLNNLFMHFVPGSQYILPNSYGNRASKGAYLPDHHDQKLQQVLAKTSDKPLFLVSHFCVSHYPYFWGESPKIGNHEGLSGMEVVHAAAIRRATEQVDWLMSNLKSAGYLDNAIIVLLTDHGHDLESGRDFELIGKQYVGHESMPEEGLIGQAFTYVNGHGVSVFDQSQIQTFLAFQINTPELKSKPAFESSGVSLIDVAPTLLDLAKIPFTKDRFDGRSLAAAVSGGVVGDLQNLPRFVESDLYFSAIADVTKVDAAKLMEETLQSYEVSNTEPLLQLKPEFFEKRLDNKIRSVLLGTWQLALLPPVNDVASTPIFENYPRTIVLFNRESKQWTNDFGTEFAAQAPVSEMIEALKSRYGSESLPWDSLMKSAIERHRFVDGRLN